MGMAYPTGAGPYAGAFGTQLGAQLGADAGRGAGGVVPVELPRVLAVKGVRDNFDTAEVRMEAVFGPPPPARQWLVQRVTHSATVECSAWIFVGGRDPRHIVAGTPNGAMGDYDAANWIPVRAGEELIVRWVFMDVSSQQPPTWARIEYWEVA